MGEEEQREWGVATAYLKRDGLVVERLETRVFRDENELASLVLL